VGTWDSDCDVSRASTSHQLLVLCPVTNNKAILMKLTYHLHYPYLGYVTEDALQNL
jgi:hypothetical protein